jgi:hypothetical protein
MEGMMSEGDAEKAAREWLSLDLDDVDGEASPHPQDVESLTDLLREREAAAWKAGAEVMREKAAVYLDGAAKTWHDDAQSDRADDADNYAHAVRALPIPEPMR